VEPLTVLVAVVLVVAAALLVSYNRFVEQRQLVRDSWANVETELQRRYDLIPNLVATVAGYADHEQAVLREVTEARARAAANHGRPADQERDERDVVTALKHLLAVSERYPELEASASFLHLQRELVTTEDRIQAARRFYNANVRGLNRRVESVPSNLVAAAFGFERADYFEVEPALREAGTPETTF
jgi:LemA protein